ncbi:type IV pilin protein [Leptolyngbya sp. FACHB-261]|uniref:type IV pilin protein n=1 Tax=Leptolyngbya sp. FACHB-261 TaxID=2692806 RepID=UPI001682AD16|nr:prepilin-type N-terminal cleavage/methylation domain-containing protein [Leptolyngbya sp. FACHB-261]MBD2103153.1 prepilin-type N-terminal cleavage/methylation domain-containing protein [Leptolyngbya sp. FACHB-261]
MYTHRERSAGFTLIELLVVILITGILGALVLPTLLGQVTRARTAEALTIMGAVRKGQEIHWTENSTYIAAGGVLANGETQVEDGNSQGIVLQDGCSQTGLSRLETGPRAMCERWKIATHPTADPTKLKIAIEGRAGMPTEFLGVYFDGGLTSSDLYIDRNPNR